MRSVVYLPLGQPVVVVREHPRKRRRVSARRLLLPPGREQLAWAAGFFDGEGTTWAGRSSGYPTLSVPQAGHFTEPPDVLLRFQAAVGGLGLVYGPILNEERNKPIWRYRVSGFEMVQAVVAMLWPWLGTEKRRQAALVFLACRARSVLPRDDGIRVGRPLGIPMPDLRGLRRGVPPRTTCSRGHDLADAYVSPVGRRQCRQCRRLNHRRSYLRQRDNVRPFCGRAEAQDQDAGAGRPHRQSPSEAVP